MKYPELIFASILGLSLGGCSVAQQTRTEGVIAQACVTFKAAETDPLVQTAIAVGTAVEPVAQLPIGVIKASGDAFCAAPTASPGAASPAVQQAGWLAGITQALVNTAASSSK